MVVFSGAVLSGSAFLAACASVFFSVFTTAGADFLDVDWLDLVEPLDLGLIVVSLGLGAGVLGLAFEASWTSVCFGVSFSPPPKKRFINPDLFSGFTTSACISESASTAMASISRQVAWEVLR